MDVLARAGKDRGPSPVDTILERKDLARIIREAAPAHVITPDTVARSAEEAPKILSTFRSPDLLAPDLKAAARTELIFAAITARRPLRVGQVPAILDDVLPG